MWAYSCVKKKRRVFALFKIFSWETDLWITIGKENLRGVWIAYFNMATRGVAGGNTPEVQPLTAYVMPYYLKTKSI